MADRRSPPLGPSGPAVVVVNPLAGRPGRGGARERRAFVERALAAHGGPGEVHLTEGPGHAAQLARMAVAHRASVVCAWGGDGTMNEVARALVGSGVALGLVPAGSGNGLARELGLPRDPSRALQVALGGRERVIDAGEAAGRVFVNLAGVGLDAAVAALFNRRGPGRRGVEAYVSIAARELFRYRPCEYAIRLDGGEPLCAPALLLVCANARQYGAGAVVAPAARPDDGRLDLVVIAPRSPLRAILAAPHLFRGTLDRVRGVRTATFATAEISAATSFPFHVDGEPFEGARVLAVRVLPASLRVRVP